MKTNKQLIFALCATTMTVGNLAADQENNQNASAGGRAEATGGTNSTYKKTVTVTSDGKRTIRKIVEVRDGVEHVTNEITDENGNVTVTPEPGTAEKQPAEEADGPWLGIRLNEASQVLRDQLGLPEDRGAVIEVVAADGPADKAGIINGDLLLTFAGEPVAKAKDLSSELQRHEVGETVEIEFMRKGKAGKINVKLEGRPADQTDEQPPSVPGRTGEEVRPNQGKAEVEIDGAGGAADFDRILSDPSLPADFKDTVREMQRKMSEFERRHGKPNGAGGVADIDAILNNPDLSSDFKDTVREINRKMREIEGKSPDRD